MNGKFRCLPKSGKQNQQTNPTKPARNELLGRVSVKENFGQHWDIVVYQNKVNILSKADIKAYVINLLFYY